jgi:hypothetical protein
LLKQFPKDKSFVSLKQLEKFLQREADYNDLTDEFDKIYLPGYVDGQIPMPGLKINDKVLKAILDMKQKLKEIQKLKN